jgi:D-alanyl-D-alanine carboxypeptidase/D-alanyl-D-alanine-endopeptidase (penicillin-binding protein 4)
MNRFAIWQHSRRRKGGPTAATWLATALVFVQFAGICVAGAQSPAHKSSLALSPAHVGARPDAARFRARVEAALKETHASRAFWGVLVSDRDTGETLYELNSDHFFTPASNAKIFTTALALAVLGRDYKFHTTLESKAALGKDGRLSGDLLFVGRGDPDISNRSFPYTSKVEREGLVERVLAEMADQAVAKGLREVDGDIVGDDSYFPYDPYPAAWTAGDLFFRFGAPVSAIAFNDNIISVRIQPGDRLGDPATITTEPNAALDTFGHQITTVGDGGTSDFAVVRQPGPNSVLLRGTIPISHAPVHLDLAMTAPAETVALALKQLLEARGVRVLGQTRVQHAPPPENNAAGEPVLSPSPLTPLDPNSLMLAEHISAPLLECIRVTNKVSNNLHAELLLRAVAQEKTGVGSTDAGLLVERNFLRVAGIADGDVVLSDGSGLGRDDLVTPGAVVTLLRYASSQPWGPDFFSTLPVAGVDGTLENRMGNTAASGRIEAKTGEVEHVRGLSGYATTVRGENLVFSIFYNNNPQTGSDSAAAVDAIATAMVETLGVEPHANKKK